VDAKTITSAAETPIVQSNVKAIKRRKSVMKSRSTWNVGSSAIDNKMTSDIGNQLATLLAFRISDTHRLETY
jgi:predicted RND superfamily exporter protein